MLKPREKEVLTLLAEGFNYTEVAQKLNLHRADVHICCSRIRQKTGIESTKSPVQCRSWLTQNPDLKKAKALPPVRPPTAKMLRAMEFYAVHKKTMEQIAWEMAISKQSAENNLNIGMARARILPRGHNSDRRAEIVAYLNSIDPMF